MPRWITTVVWARAAGVALMGPVLAAAGPVPAFAVQIVRGPYLQLVPEQA